MNDMDEVLAPKYLPAHAKIVNKSGEIIHIVFFIPLIGLEKDDNFCGVNRHWVREFIMSEETPKK